MNYRYYCPVCKEYKVCFAHIFRKYYCKECGFVLRREIDKRFKSVKNIPEQVEIIRKEIELILKEDDVIV